VEDVRRIFQPAKSHTGGRDQHLQVHGKCILHAGLMHQQLSQELRGATAFIIFQELTVIAHLLFACLAKS
jgi:hypothetical protein